MYVCIAVLYSRLFVKHNRSGVDERKLRNWGELTSLLTAWRHGYVVMVANGNDDTSLTQGLNSILFRG